MPIVVAAMPFIEALISPFAVTVTLFALAALPITALMPHKTPLIAPPAVTVTAPLPVELARTPLPLPAIVIALPAAVVTEIGPAPPATMPASVAKIVPPVCDMATLPAPVPFADIPQRNGTIVLPILASDVIAMVPAVSALMPVAKPPVAVIAVLPVNVALMFPVPFVILRPTPPTPIAVMLPPFSAISLAPAPVLAMIA
ncbi:MAG: hypothetical protein J0H01_31530 [Rhizobiales bacterium]|nr:hypothetical protein [Hyphomicrobiales bacterium]